MNVNNLTTIYDINAGCPPGRIVVSHDCDVNTRTVEVFFRQGVIPLAISQDCAAKAAFVERQSNILINDNVPCTVTEAGSVLIPVDDLHRQGRFDMSIELTVTNQDGEQVLVTPFPMWITVNGSILNEAEVTEESKGTVPELLEAAEEALAEAKDYENLDNLPAINGHTLIGDQTAEDLDISGGTDDYNELSNKPTINGFDISGNIQLQIPFFVYQNVHYDDAQHWRLSIDTDHIFHTGGHAFNFLPRNRSSMFEMVNPDFPFPAELPNNDTGVIFRFVNQYYDESEETGSNVHISAPNYIFFSSKGTIFRRTDQLIDGTYFTKGEWKQIGGGSEIVSGVVNQNGTITFTDSNGNTFTTTGASVIGADGFSPVATVTPTASGATISITDKNGTTTANISNGADGQDYVLTPQDKTDIANIVLQLLPTTQGVLYGNASN